MLPNRYYQRIVFLKEGTADKIKRVRDKLSGNFDLVITSPKVSEQTARMFTQTATTSVTELAFAKNAICQKVIKEVFEELGDVDAKTFAGHPDFAVVDTLALEAKRKIVEAIWKAQRPELVLVVGSDVMLNLAAMHILFDRCVINPECTSMLNDVVLLEGEAFDAKFYDRHNATVEHLKLD